MDRSLKVFSLDGEQMGSLQVKDIVSNWDPTFFHSEAVFQTVISELSSTRLARPHTKTKGEISGGGKKPYRQKHTGRARQGSRRNPQFVGGGVVFGPRKEVNHYKKVNKRVRALAVKSCWTQAIVRDKLFIIDTKELEGFPANKTKTISRLLKKAECDPKRIFLLVEKLEEPLVLGARNIEGVEVCLAESISLNNLMKATSLVLSTSGLEWLKLNHFQKWS
ncbi:50S ribosomal protein L4 [Candidatus Mycoplasma haematominutum]|uniref:Large ribosomal subunit protein uL4 n=1 Tax=Candidatus Mycoplasma haematominutum 'Birmingham 1' TaxID=1116213 RepID=G8C315_9MOLU|nr:50S ribosomal protein L4 [Candidatus Mycoplasma haematominutum]CCE66713.1 ribosomal protein L4 [Candidatus Mycoplasma haematominutum 'Birmingham 1']